MALSLWQGPNRLGDVCVHSVVAQKRSGRFGCVLAFMRFCFADYDPLGGGLELRNEKGERLAVRVVSLARGPGATLVAEFDGATGFDWRGGARLSVA